MNIIITGASRGIGKHIALNFAARGGHKIILISRNEEKLNLLCDQADKASELIPLPFDLESGDYDLLAKTIRQHSGEIHILINNAGALINKKFGHLSADDFDHMMNVNVKSAFLISQKG